MVFPTKRPYLAFLTPGVVFLGFAIAGRSPLYYAVATVFFAAAFMNRRRVQP